MARHHGGGAPYPAVFIDAGAGTGSTTAWLAGRFDRTVALEPNPSLCEELRRACPGVEILPDTIMDAKPPELAELVIVLQSPGTDCMNMLAHFHHRRFDLAGAAVQFQGESVGRYRMEIENVPAPVTTPDRESAVTIAEFMLNLLPMPAAPPRQELEEYVKARFASGDGFRFSCHQDFLRITPQDGA